MPVIVPSVISRLSSVSPLFKSISTVAINEFSGEFSSKDNAGRDFMEQQAPPFARARMRATPTHSILGSFILLAGDCHIPLTNCWHTMSGLDLTWLDTMQQDLRPTIPEGKEDPVGRRASRLCPD
jgi:hypothetical protein